MKNHCRVATRSSKLALWQTHHVVGLLEERFPACTFEIVEMSTKGDRNLDQALSKIGDKGLFTRELEDAMLAGDIDFAVHSLKDMPTALPEGLALTAMIRREDPRDALLAKEGQSIADLPEGAVVGTSSLRRRAQLLSQRPDLQVKDLRGNVQTRIRKYEEGFDAAVLATVGLERMELDHYIVSRLDPAIFVPAVGQGIVVVESRTDDEELLYMLSAIHDEDAFLAATAERAFMQSLEGGCQVPIGALAVRRGPELLMRGFVGLPDGSETVYVEAIGDAKAPEALGQALAKQALDRGARAVLAQVRNQ